MFGKTNILFGSSLSNLKFIVLNNSPTTNIIYNLSDDKSGL